MSLIWRLHDVILETFEIYICILASRDVTAGKIEMRPLRWWAESALPGRDRVKVTENLGATSVAPVAPVDTSLIIQSK